MRRWAVIGPRKSGQEAHLNTTIASIFILEQAVPARIGSR